MHRLRSDPVAHDDPINGVKPGLSAQLPRGPDHFGIDRRSLDVARDGIDMRQKVEIDEAVIERRHQRIRQRMRDLAEPGMRARTINQNKRIELLDRGNRRRKSLVIWVFTGL